MKRSRWIVATAALALGLSAGAFAENQPWQNRRDDDHARYEQRYRSDRDDAYSYGDGYRGYQSADRNYRRDGEHDRDDVRRTRDRDRDHHNRDYGRRDRDDRPRDRN